MKRCAETIMILMELFITLLAISCFALLCALISVVDGVGDLRRRNAMKKLFEKVLNWYRHFSKETK
jgi:hypothetical protein